MLVELEVPEILQDERLGHRPPSMRGVYAHITPGMRTAMIDALEARWQESTARAGVEVAGLFNDSSAAERTREREQPGAGISCVRWERGTGAQ